ncbi:MAG: hypothetical protein ACK559_09060 [bacterium]
MIPRPDARGPTHVVLGRAAVVGRAHVSDACCVCVRCDLKGHKL